ncbi:MAG: c-type cytochrome biogenesis protein CcmI [Rugosibacter sp.]
MTLFIFAIAALLLVTLFSLLRPWWRRQTSQRRVASAVPLDTAAHNFPAMLNTTIHRDRLAELERDHKNGVISAAGYAQAQEELQRQLLEDAAQPQDTNASGAKSWRDGLVLAAFVPLLAIGLYVLVGSPAGLTGTGNAAQSDNAQAMNKVNTLIAKLEAKMQQNPDNPEGWAMLARAYRLTGRLDEAERALGRVGPTINQDAALLADLAEILAQKNDSLAGRPGELILQALKLEPNNGKALYFAGAAAFEEGRYNVAIAHWEQLKKQLDPQSDDARNVAAGIAKAREMGGVKVGAGDTAPVAKATNVTAAPDTAIASAVSGRVELSPALRAQTTPGETVFIFARAVNGPRMPLAIQQARVADLPLDFHLDDTQAMAPENKISTVKELRIEVRVSKTGQAMPASGDLTGSSAPVKPGTKGIQVVIDQVVK